MGSEELDVVGVADLDGCGEDAGELDEEAFFGGTADFEEEAFDAVEGAGAYDAYAGAVHGWSEFVGRVVSRGLGGADGGDEAVHVGVGDGHGGAVCVSLEVSILEGVSVCDDGVEAVARGVDKQ